MEEFFGSKSLHWLVLGVFSLKSAFGNMPERGTDLADESLNRLA
jgi:hypothetical protein